MTTIFGVITLALATGCSWPGTAEVRRLTVQMAPGLPQERVRELFGEPRRAYANPAGWHASGWGRGFSVDQNPEDELIWEYRKGALEVTFRRGAKGWVVRSWSSR
jgi:hypothetical protein